MYGLKGTEKGGASSRDGHTDLSEAVEIQGMGIGVLHDPDTILRQNSLSTQAFVQSLTPVLHFEAALSLQWQDILYCTLGSECPDLPSVPTKLFKTIFIYLHLWIAGCVHTDLTSKIINSSVCNFL